jgi:hypothetical protein
LKRLSAILFLLVLVFNFYGYRLVIAFMEQNSEVAIEQKVDRSDYNTADLISIKTALNLPYYSSSPHFERAYGSVTVNGVAYEYVQKRVYNDTLELLCLPNGAKTALQGLKAELTKATADGQASVPAKKGATTLKISLPDYCQSFETTAVVSVPPISTFPFQNESFFLTGFTRQQERPPQAI